MLENRAGLPAGKLKHFFLSQHHPTFHQTHAPCIVLYIHFRSYCCSSLFSCPLLKQVCDSVFTPCFNTTSGTGFFLDLEAATDVTIEGFSTMSQGAGTRDVELYYRPGGFAGYETDAAAWTLAGSASGFDPVSAISCPIPVTPLPITFNVCIPAGERYGFYLASTSGSGSFELYDTLTTGTLFSDDGTLRLYVGKGAFAFGAFTGFVTQNKLMQGTIQYSCGCSTGMQHPSAASNVRLFPSIVTREFQLDLSKAQGVYQSARILDSAGRLLDQLELDATATSIIRNVASLSPGVYTLQLTGLKSSAQLKFVRSSD